MIPLLPNFLFCHKASRKETRKGHRLVEEKSCEKIGHLRKKISGGHQAVLCSSFFTCPVLALAEGIWCEVQIITKV